MSGLSALPRLSSFATVTPMRDVYLFFLVVLVLIGAVGIFAARHSVSPRDMARVGVLARIIGSLTAAGLLAFAFVNEQLADPEVDFVAFFQSVENRDALAIVTLLVSAGATGLLAAAALAIFDPPATKRYPRLVRCGRWCLRWAGGCLATATVAVILLFPATVVLILLAGDAPRAG